MKYFIAAVFFLVLGGVITVAGVQGQNQSPVWFPIAIAGSMILMIVFLALHFLHSLEEIDTKEDLALKLEQGDVPPPDTPVEVFNLDDEKTSLKTV